MTLQSLAIWLSRQRQLPYKFRRSLIKRLHPLMLKDFAFEADFFDASMALSFSGNIVNYIDRLIYFCGAHEKYMLCMLRDYVWNLRAQGNASITFLDVGANAGNHTLFMAKLVDTVYAFEPYPRVRTQLENNLARNAITNVKLYPFGLSNQDAVLPFYAAPDSNLGAASFKADHKQDNYYLGDMELKRGDDVIGETKIDILKADVEGFEKFVLEGLRATLERDRPLIIIELSPSTRETLGSAEALINLFPSHYHFYYFAKGKQDSGAYRLDVFDYARFSKIQDVIACPHEKVKTLTGA